MSLKHILKQILKPTKVKLVFLVILLAIYLFLLLSKPCPDKIRICAPNIADKNVNALQGTLVPLTCQQVCSNKDYAINLTLGILLVIIIPAIVLYIILSLLLAVGKGKKKK